MSVDDIQYKVHDYDPVNKYIDEKARLRRTKSVWGYTRSLALFLVALGIFLIFAAYAYHIFKKPHPIEEILNSDNENISEKKIDGKIIKYNSTTHLFDSHKTDDGFRVTTRRMYSTTKDLLEKTDNYDESCYVEKSNITIEYGYGLDTQIENMNLMGLDKNSAADLEKYCKYTK
jgi:hypothetical protein|tara:strand:+ start:2813 stop:3334 length:522 start_codon:yes stop_codon:yes gene_type:complete